MSKHKRDRKREKLRRHGQNRQSGGAAKPAAPVQAAATVASMNEPRPAPASPSVSGNPLLEDASDLWKRLYDGIARRLESL